MQEVNIKIKVDSNVEVNAKTILSDEGAARISGNNSEAILYIVKVLLNTLNGAEVTIKKEDI